MTVNLRRFTKCIVAAVSGELWLCLVLITGNTHLEQHDGENQNGNVVNDESEDCYYNAVPGHISQLPYTAVRDNISPPFYAALERNVGKGKEDRFNGTVELAYLLSLISETRPL